MHGLPLYPWPVTALSPLTILPLGSQRCGCLGTTTISLPSPLAREWKAGGVERSGSLTIRAAGDAFIDAQDCQELALGNPSTAFPVLVEALARCGDAKFGGVVEMTFASPIRAVVQAVLRDACEQFEGRARALAFATAEP